MFYYLSYLQYFIFCNLLCTFLTHEMWFCWSFSVFIFHLLYVAGMFEESQQWEIHFERLACGSHAACSEIPSTASGTVTSTHTIIMIYYQTNSWGKHITFLRSFTVYSTVLEWASLIVVLKWTTWGRCLASFLFVSDHYTTWTYRTCLRCCRKVLLSCFVQKTFPGCTIQHNRSFY